MWLNESKTRIFFDMHLPAWPGKGIAEGFDPPRIAEAFATAGADSAILYAKCQYGNFYTRLEGEGLHPGLGGRDLLEELAGELRARGIRSLAYYSVSWDERIAAERPEWLAENGAGDRGAGPYRWKTLCIGSPYADLIERQLRAIAAKRVDGIWLDMTIIGDGNCHCKRCSEAFRNAYGRPLPREPRGADRRDFLEFRYGQVEAFYARIRSSLREAAPELVFTNNYWGYPYSSTGMGSRAVGAARQTDFVTGEAYSDWTGLRSTSFFPIFLRGVAAGRPYEALVGRFINTWDYTKKPKPFLAYESYALFAHGATVTVDDMPYHDGRIDEDLYGSDLAEIFGQMRLHAPAVAGRPLRYAAVYHSQKTKDALTEQVAFVRAVSGAFRLLRDLHLSVEFLFDESIAQADLRGLRLIVLPEVSLLDEAEWRILEAFMAAGGLVVATGSLAGAGARLAMELFGLEGGELSPFSISYLRGSPGSSRDLLVRGHYAHYEAREPGRGEIVDPLCETSATEFFHNNLPPPFRATGLPAIHEYGHGSGAFVLFPQPLFSHYAKEPSSELKTLVGSLAASRAGAPAVELRIPMKMDFSLVEDGDTLHVHLLNPNAESSLCCGLMDTLDGHFERSYEYMEETVPVRDLGIILRRDDVESAECLREGSALEIRRIPDGVEIRVDRVELWEIVRIRFASKGQGHGRHD